MSWDIKDSAGNIIGTVEKTVEGFGFLGCILGIIFGFFIWCITLEILIIRGLISGIKYLTK